MQSFYRRLCLVVLTVPLFMPFLKVDTNQNTKRQKLLAFVALMLIFMKLICFLEKKRNNLVLSQAIIQAKIQSQPIDKEALLFR